MDWEYRPFPAPFMPLISSAYILHLWQNPRHMNKSDYVKQHTTIRRFLRPFCPRGPSSNHVEPDQTRPHTRDLSKLAWHIIKDKIVRSGQVILSYAEYVTQHRHALQNLGSSTIEPPPSFTPSSEPTNRTTTTTNPLSDLETAPIPTFQNRSSWLFHTTPKKLNAELSPCFNDDSHPPVGWGLYFQEDFSTPPVLFWLLALHMLACLVFLLAKGVFKVPEGGDGGNGDGMAALLSVPALLVAAATFAYAMVSKNCECTSKSRGPPT